MEKVVIVGGGIAGLSCLNALLDQGVSPLLLEGGTIGTPKMCGEFLAPLAVNYLKKWGIGPVVAIHKADFFAGKKQISFPFPKSAGAMARSDVELQLAARARQLGGRIREKSHIQKTIPATGHSPYQFELDSGELIEADVVFFATGKYGQSLLATIEPEYLGMKLHFKHVVKPATLQMHSIIDGYLGVVPISQEMSNCACLIKREAVLKAGSLEQYIQKEIVTQPSLKSIFFNIDINQMPSIQGPAPHFKLKELPDWPRAYWIGDAFATLYPAIGSGFTHGIQSAILAAACYQKNQLEGYRKDCLTAVKPKVFLGKWIHSALLKPSLLQLAMPVLQKNPWAINWCLGKLGYL